MPDKEPPLSWIDRDKKEAEKNDEPAGEPHTGFEEEDGRGPFQCGNCVHMDGEVCTHPVMIEKSKQPRDKENRPLVDKEDCCDFVRRPAKSAKNKDDKDSE